MSLPKVHESEDELKTVHGDIPSSVIDFARSRIKELGHEIPIMQRQLERGLTNRASMIPLAEAEAEELRLFLQAASDAAPSCTNVLCDCIEARAHKAEAALARVQAFIDYPYRDGELTPEQYRKISEALRAIIADD
jgi:hypothetical protein